ncbi:MAG: hypothetical protein LCH57_07065, partial [Proteobacteria bacterium]|nr:hypothetical protein [Pseudomonadota bacterium]
MLTEAQRLRAQARQVVVAAEQVLEGARQRGHEAELAVAAASARAEEHGPPPDEDPGEVDPEAERRRIDDLERRRRMMGNVNPLAAEELEEMQGRLTEIGEQVADLESASESLRSHM